MAIAKPLTKEEVPEAEHWRFQFESQWTVKNESGKSRSFIQGLCPVCLERVHISVNDVRNFLRGRRGQMPGTHRACKYSGIITTKEGYVWLYTPDHPKAYDGKYVPQHILVMEAHLGRFLDRDSESVHHINGDRSDNRIENLQLRTKYHGKGQKRICGDCGSHNVVSVPL